MILNKIKKFFLKNKKEILFLSFFLIFIFSIGDNTFAATTGDTKAAGAVNTSGIVEGMNFFLKIFATLVGLLASLISLLLNPGWINGTIFGLDVYMKDIWILISNIVYFAFAFILIIIAFMNIVGKGGGTWELKSALPKFVVGVVMVPFTWFFVQFILSISAFLTISVLSLPYDIMHGKAEFKQVEKQKICLKYTFDLNTNKDTKKDSTKQLKDCLAGTQATKDTDGDWAYIGDVLNGNVKSNSSSSSIFSLINIYTYGVMQVDKVTEVTKDQLQGIKSIGSLTVKVIFDFLFLVVFLIILIALFMALFARGTWLWIYAMFSPVFGLLFFFGKSKEGINKISPVEFIKLAMVPVYVSAALAFGMIFMFTAAHGLTDTSGGKQIFTKDSGDNSSTLQLGVFSITLKGIQGGDPGTNGIFSSLGNGIGQLLLEIFGLVLLWIAVMAALKHSEITGGIIEPIAQFGKSIGQLAAKAPQYAPIFPTPGGGVSASGIQYAASSFKSDIETKSRNTGSKITSLFGGPNAKMTESINGLKSSIDNLGIETTDTAKKMREAMKGKTASDLSINPYFINQAKRYEKVFKNKKDKEEYIRLITSKNGNDFSKGMLMVDKYMDENGMSKYSPISKNNQGVNIGKGTEEWFNSNNGINNKKPDTPATGTKDETINQAKGDKVKKAANDTKEAIKKKDNKDSNGKGGDK